MKAKVLFVFGLLATLFASMPTFAQNAYYFHFKDGSMQVFYTDWVDSMSVSKLDFDGVEHEDFVIQQVWMNDTVFSYALADIDSVNFVTPKIVYQPGVIKLEDGLDRYVVAHDSMTITLDSATPSKMRPHKGDKLVYLQMTEMFPNGFAGEVIDIEGNKLECGLVDLSEVFVQYYSTSESSVQTRAMDSVKFKGTWEPGAIPIPTDWLGGADVDGDKDLEESCGFSFSNDFSAEITPVVEVRGFLSVTPQMGTYVCVSSTGTYDLNEKIELSGEFKKDFQKDLLSVNIPLNTPLLQAYAKLYGYFRPTISASLSASFNQQFKSAFLYNVCSKMPAPLKDQPLTIRKSAASSSCVGVSLSGDVEAGIGGEIGIKVADKVLRKDDEAKIFAKFEAGAKMEGEVSFTKAELDNATKTTDLYDNLKDKEIKANIVYGAGVGADLELAVLNLNKNFEIGFTKEFPEPFFKRSFVPLFAEKPNVKRKDDRPSVLDCTSSLSNECLVPVSVGHAVYYDGELVAKGFYDKTYVSQEASFKKYQMEFEGNSTSKKYTVAPLIKLFGFEMIASPSSEVDRCVTVSTNSAQNITYESADISGTVKGYDASSERPTVGFYCGTKEAFYRGNGRTVYASLAKDQGSGQFKITLSDLQDKTTYYYVAFVENNIDDVIYGDTLSFTTLKEEIEDKVYKVKTHEAQNITDKSATLFGTISNLLGNFEKAGFCYGKESDFCLGNASMEYADCNLSGVYGGCSWKLDLSDLESETTYFFVAFATNTDGIVYGDTLSFTTEKKRMDETPYHAPLSYFYKTANGDAWTYNYGWNDTTKSLANGEWYGVELMKYTSSGAPDLDIKLQDNNLSGNAVVKKLKDLFYLNLSENNLQSLTLDSVSLIGSKVVIEKNRASSPLNFEIKDSKCKYGFGLEAKGTNFDDIILKGNDFSGDLTFDVNKVNNLSILDNKNLSALYAYRGHEEIFLNADKISLINDSINTNSFAINYIKASSFVMDNCATDTYGTQVSFGKCTIDEVIISNCKISLISVGESSTIKAFKLNGINYDRNSIFIYNNGNANFYISNCRIDERMLGDGTGMFYIKDSRVGDFYISEFSGTASDLQGYLESMRNPNFEQ